MTQKGKRGGNVKANAPDGFYTAAQAMKRLDLDKSAFYYYVSTGKIKRVVVPPKRNGYYRKKEIDDLADAMTLALLQTATEEQLDPTEFKTATKNDADAIYNVVKSLGWQATPASLRRTWYEVNPEIDHVVVQNGVVMGYINTVPYLPEALEDMMAGRKKGWDIRPSDILPFEPGHEYDLFVGLAERKDAKERGRYGLRLILGFRHVLEEWAKRGIIIRHLLAHSAEEDGQRLCAILGFEPTPAVPGDLYPRYMLDLQQSDHPFAQQYKSIVGR